MANQDGAMMTVHQAANELEGMEGLEEMLGFDQVEDDEPADAVEASDESIEEDAEDLEDEASDEAEEDEQADEEQAIETLADIASALDVDEQELQANLTTTIKVDGKESSVTLAELKNGYQREADYRRKTMELAESRRANEARTNEQLEAMQTQASIVSNVLQQAYAMVAGNRAEIDRLQATDPQKWAVEVTRHNDLMGRFHQLYQNVASHHHQVVSAQTQKKQADRESLEASEKEKLWTALGGWDEQRATAIPTFLQKLGYTTDEINQTLDHRFFLLADKARQFEESVATAAVAKKKVKSLPKRQAPAKAGVTVKQSSLRKAQQRLSRSGTRKDAGAAIGAIPGIDKMLGL